MNKYPSKSDSFYIIEMLKSSLINSRLTIPWADSLIKKMDNAPLWLFDVSINKFQEHQINALSEYAYSEPFEDYPNDIDKFHIACLWFRYERRELSWATLLKEIGGYLDTFNGEWDCETPYHYLNVFEDAGFTIESEEITKNNYLNKQNVKSYFNHVNEKLKWFS